LVGEERLHRESTYLESSPGLYKIMRKIISYSIGIFCFFISFLLLKTAVAAPVSIMPLGDSITSGSASGAKPGEEVSYRKALRDKLVAAGYEIVFVGSQKPESPTAADLNHEGHGGWCASGCFQNQSDILREIDHFLANNSPDVVLLHTGTNDIGSHHHPEEIISAVSGILDKIYRYGREQKRQIWVVLALIINGQNPPCLYCQQTTAYNQALKRMAQNRIQNGDKLGLVDMENGAGIDYRRFPDGDMWNFEHPHERGYQKMADVWFEGLKKILIPSGKNIYQDFKANYASSMRYFDGEKKESSPVLTAQTSPTPLPPDPISPLQPSATSEKQPIPEFMPEPRPGEGLKTPRGKESPSDKQATQPGEPKGYAIQVNAFRDLNKAKEFVETQKKQGVQVYLGKADDKDQMVWFRVFMGHFADREEAARNMKEMKIREIFPNSFVQKLP
jgi:cell division septation protein DedD/lysophospholipase L1-like esterase